MRKCNLLPSEQYAFAQWLFCAGMSTWKKKKVANAEKLNICFALLHYYYFILHIIHVFHTPSLLLPDVSRHVRQTPVPPPYHCPSDKEAPHHHGHHHHSHNDQQHKQPLPCPALDTKVRSNKTKQKRKMMNIKFSASCSKVMLEGLLSQTKPTNCSSLHIHNGQNRARSALPKASLWNWTQEEPRPRRMIPNVSWVKLFIRKSLQLPRTSPLIL